MSTLLAKTGSRLLRVRLLDLLLGGKMEKTVLIACCVFSGKFNHSGPSVQSYRAS